MPSRSRECKTLVGTRALVVRSFTIIRPITYFTQPPFLSIFQFFYSVNICFFLLVNYLVVIWFMFRMKDSTSTSFL
jgi:hypothetical protein